MHHISPGLWVKNYHVVHFQVLLLHLVTLTFIVSIVNYFVLKCVDVSVFI